MTPSLTRIDILRHGEPVGGRRYRGQIDDPLSERGWAEMRAATAGERPWTAIVSSPLARCRAFAEALAAENDLPLRFDPRWMEVGFGVWEGRTAAEIEAATPGAVRAFKRDPVGCRPAGAEPLAAFHARIADAFETVLAGHVGGHPLVVAHAGAIRMAIAYVLGMPAEHAYRIQVASAARARFQIESGEWGEHRALLHLTPTPGGERDARVKHLAPAGGG